MKAFKVSLLLVFVAFGLLASFPQARTYGYAVTPRLEVPAFLSVFQTSPERMALHGPPGGNKPQYIIVIIQENRTVDDFFNGLPGANTAQGGYDSLGHYHPLQMVSEADMCSSSHAHPNFVTEYNAGHINGWDLASFGCRKEMSPPSPFYGDTLPDGLFAYVNPAETALYRGYAQNYGFADEVFQHNQGPSFPSHQFSIAGQSGEFDTDHWGMAENSSKVYCGTSKHPSVTQINYLTPFPGVEGNKSYGCKDYETIFDLAAAQGYTWSYYCTAPQGLWDGPNAVLHHWDAGPSQQCISPPPAVMSAITGHTLTNLTFVTPDWDYSDHPHGKPTNPEEGEDWVSMVVNAVGTDPYYWNNCQIFVYWDDWGGWFDHVTPPILNAYDGGFRVPLIAIGPYVKPGVVDHTPYYLSAVLHYIEDTWGLGTLNTMDNETGDLSNMFNYSQTPSPYYTENNGGWTPPPGRTPDPFEADG